MNLRKIFLSLLLLLFFLGNAYAVVRLPRLISDGMVLQRDEKVIIWGWADPQEPVSVTFDGMLYKTIADAHGNWQLKLKPHKAGGDYTMLLHGSNKLYLNNITFGDVWLCSGQSNMELPMRRVKPLYEEEIRTASNRFIRQFIVPQKYNFKQPEADFSTGSWQEVTPQTIQNFSAVAYFFAKELNAHLGVPVGILNASLGGSPAQAWMSEEALKKFPEYLHEAYRWRDDELIRTTEMTENKKINSWYAEVNSKDAGHKNMLWSSPDLNDSDWDTFRLPGYWADKFPGIKNGVVWFRKEIMLSKQDAAKSAFLNLGRIVDADSVFINGKCVGNVTYQYPPRWYDVPANVLQEGRNMIAVRVISNAGKGGFVPDKPYELVVGNTKIDLKGDWKMKKGCDMPVTPSQTFIRWKPLGLFNAMIAPLTMYSKKGVVWYQGEANTGRPDEYAKLLPALITDWRAAFGQPTLPFIYAQLPNFMETQSEPSESGWAKLREAQLKTLAVKNTAMAVTIDAGEWNDIHPLNKKLVADRLAKEAFRIVYKEHDKRLVPVLLTIKKRQGGLLLIFDRLLYTIADTAPLQIAIAGADRKFVWGRAKIQANVLTVWSEKVAEPVAVRYAWADNPLGANLCDNEGNLLSPFRTDNW